MTEADIPKIFDDREQIEAGVQIVRGLDVSDTPTLRQKVDSPGKQGVTLLVVAMGARNKTAMRRLLVMGASPNQRTPDGESPVLLAAGADDREFIETLLRAGGNPNVRNVRNEPALFTAATQRRWNNLYYMVDNGADVNATDIGGNTILHYCAQVGQFEPIPALIERGANFQKANNHGRTLGDLVLSSRVNPASAQGAMREKVRQILLARGAIR